MHVQPEPAYHDPAFAVARMNYMSDANRPVTWASGSAMLEQVCPGLDPCCNRPSSLRMATSTRKALFTQRAAYFQLLSSAGLCALYAISFAIQCANDWPVTGWTLTGTKVDRRQRILTLSRLSMQGKDYARRFQTA